MLAVLILSTAFTATKNVSAQVAFPADNQPTVAPSPPPANPATYVASYSFTANWSSVSGATGYQLDVSTNSSFSTYVTGYQNLNVGNATSRSVTGLNASTSYYYRVRAYNGAGTSGNSNVVNVRTLSPTGAPVATTNPATFIASFSATLNALLNPHGLPTTVHFQYGTTSSYGLTTVPQNRNGNTFQTFGAGVTGLTANTLYHFQVVASNEAGTTMGIDRTFTTLTAIGPPVVITNAATNVATSSATLNGSLNPHALTTNVFFQYGTTTSYGSVTPMQTQNGNTYRNITANINGLAPHTTYHFRIVATNTGGSGNGNDRTFTTSAPPSITPSPSPTGTFTPTATPTATATATPTATHTPTATATHTPPPTATAPSPLPSQTPRPTPTPRAEPTPRPRPTPSPRP